MQLRYYTFITTIAVLMLAACETRPKQTVWDLYDVRTPLPSNSQVPRSRAEQYDRYRDNDEFYIPPNYGCGGIGPGGCD